MKKSSISFLYAFSLYAAISIIMMSVQFLASRLVVYGLFNGMGSLLAGGGVYPVKPVVYDSAGFAFMTVTNTLLQYYLASLLARAFKDRCALFGILALSAIVSTTFFMKISLRTGFNSYALPGLPLILSYLLGGATAILQKEDENPFHASKWNIFKI